MATLYLVNFISSCRLLFLGLIKAAVAQILIRRGQASRMYRLVDLIRSDHTQHLIAQPKYQSLFNGLCRVRHASQSSPPSRMQWTAAPRVARPVRPMQFRQGGTAPEGTRSLGEGGGGGGRTKRDCEVS